MDSTNLFALPDLIWSQVFANLPLDDVKNVRLTCRRFHELSNDSSIQRDEEIVLHGHVSTISTILSLSNVSRKVWNLKLDAFSVTDETILPFFEKQGTHIRSLVFQKCEFAAGILKRIVELCVELRSISFVYSTYPYVSLGYFLENGYVDYIFDDFKALEDESIVRPSLTDFTFVTPFKPYLTNRRLLRFFTVFPSIQRLDLELDVGQEFDQFSPISADISSDSVFSFSSIYSQLSSMRDRLKKLRLKFENDPSYHSCVSVDRLIQIRHMEMRNLKELSLNWINLQPDVGDMYSFVEFRHLTHFDCEISNRLCTNASVSTFLQQLLGQCPLYSLKFTDYNFRIDRQLFGAFVGSKLKILGLHMKDDYPSVLSTRFRASALEDTLIPNYTLEELHFERGTRNLMLLFPAYFHSLKSLEFPEVHEDVLQNIFQQQTDIRHLFLHNCARWPYKKCVFRRLGEFQSWLRREEAIKRELEYLLKLYIGEENYSLSNFLLDEFRFPKLKTLSISVRFSTELDPLDCEQLWQRIHKVPWLQYLKLDVPVALSFAQLLALFGGLSKLRHFCISDSRTELLPDEEYRRFFHLFPSLRSVQHRLKYSTIFTKYFYDVTTKTVVDV